MCPRGKREGPEAWGKHREKELRGWQFCSPDLGLEPGSDYPMYGSHAGVARVLAVLGRRVGVLS